MEPKPKPKIDLNQRLDMNSPEVRAQLPPQMREDWEAKAKERERNQAERAEKERVESAENQEKLRQVQEQINQQPKKASNPVIIGKDFERHLVEAARMNAERKATEDAKKEAAQPSKGVWSRVKNWFR